MSWNDGIERKKFMARMKKQAEEYRAAGMTEEQIQAMFEFDLGVYKSDRNFYTHTQQFDTHESNDEGEEMEECFVRQFIDTFTVSNEKEEDEYLSGSSRFGWIDTIENPELAKVLRELCPLDKEIITMTVFEGYKLIELEPVLNVPYRTLKYHWASIKSIISKVFS